MIARFKRYMAKGISSSDHLSGIISTFCTQETKLRNMSGVDVTAEKYWSPIAASYPLTLYSYPESLPNKVWSSLATLDYPRHYSYVSHPIRTIFYMAGGCNHVPHRGTGIVDLSLSICGLRRD